MLSNLSDKKRALELLNWLNDASGHQSIDKTASGHVKETSPDDFEVSKFRFKRGMMILTSADIRKDFKKYQPDLMVSVGQYMPVYGCPNIVIDVDDDSYIHIARKYKSLILENLEKVHTVMKDNGTVIVHCHAGMSRSPTFMAFYLITYCRMDAMKALQFLKNRRSIVYPNLGFLTIMAEYERELDRRNPGISTNLTLAKK